MMMTIAKITWDFSAVGSQQGWTIFVIGWLVVFSALILLSLVFRSLPKIMEAASNRKAKKAEQKAMAAQKTTTESKEVPADGELTGDVTAAIAFALHEYFNDLHDDEARILKVVHKSRKYSPWNSKIYNVGNFKR